MHDLWVDVDHEPVVGRAHECTGGLLVYETSRRRRSPRRGGSAASDPVRDGEAGRGAPDETFNVVQSVLAGPASGGDRSRSTRTPGRPSRRTQAVSSPVPPDGSRRSFRPGAGATIPAAGREHEGENSYTTHRSPFGDDDERPLVGSESLAGAHTTTSRAHANNALERFRKGREQPPRRRVPTRLRGTDWMSRHGWPCSRERSGLPPDRAARPCPPTSSWRRWSWPSPHTVRVHVRNAFVSVDPYMRGRMNETRSYVPPFALGEPLSGRRRRSGRRLPERPAAGRCLGSCTTSAGAKWPSPTGVASDGRSRCRPRLDVIGRARNAGLTAYVGVVDIGAVSSARRCRLRRRGRVGSIAAQLARNRGAPCDRKRRLGRRGSRGSRSSGSTASSTIGRRRRRTVSRHARRGSTCTSTMSAARPSRRRSAPSAPTVASLPAARSRATTRSSAEPGPRNLPCS